MPIPGPPITASSIVRFVDSIGATPTVRLDINDGASFITLRDGTSFNPPPLNQPTTAIPGVFDGAIPSASSYGNRVIDLKLRLKGTDEDALATLVRLLMVELNRETNILMLQVGATPVFFRTYRTSAEDIDFGDLGLGECTVTIPILAEPFAYGLRQDLGPYTITNNPASGTHPMYVDITGVVGDVDAPARLSYTSSTFYPMVAARARPTAQSLLFVQAESGTLGADTTLPGADAAMSGAGSNYARVSFATSTSLVARSTGIPLGVAGVDLRGIYRMFLRVRFATSGTFAVRVQVASPANTQINSDATLSGASGGPFWVDMGLVHLPLGGEDPVYDGLSGSELPVAAHTANFFAGRTAGTGTLDLDALVLAPASDSMALLTVPASALVLDGATDAAYALAGGNLSGYNITRAGALPSLRPGSWHNLLAFMASVGTAVADSVTTTHAVTVSYWPRYLTV